MHDPFESPSSHTDTRPATTPQLEDYLDHLCAPLLGRMVYERRLAIREEVRAHILVLADAHEELGHSPAEALHAAIQQFGDARQVGSALSRQYPAPFEFHKARLWIPLHVAISGVIGSFAFINMDFTLQRMHETTYVALNFDCILGMAFGWISATQLLKRPVSPLRAAARTGLLYTALTSGLMVIISVLNNSHNFKQFTQSLFVIGIMGIQGALGGGVMAALFRFLRRYAPDSPSKFITAR